jgi:hypothetical protein
MLQQQIQMRMLMDQLSLEKKHGKSQEQYAFWNTQPVPKMGMHLDAVSSS